MTGREARGMVSCAAQTTPWMKLLSTTYRRQATVPCAGLAAQGVNATGLFDTRAV
jgi:hypothetical protein